MFSTPCLVENLMNANMRPTNVVNNRSWRKRQARLQEKNEKNNYYMQNHPWRYSIDNFPQGKFRAIHPLTVRFTLVDLLFPARNARRFH
jgi:hypothetical protein